MKTINQKQKRVKITTTKRDQYTVVLEDLRANFRVFGEALAGLSGRVDEEFEKMGERFEAIDRRFEAIDKRFDGIDKKLDSHSEMIAQLMIDVNEIKSDLKQKVNRDEFARLEKRVIMLERRMVA
ncbi:MAG: hypothetical protein COV07_01460 [Candidatus Vogelbacteria bacterium CG10_big_fil_rev_8_21_14_0_10_45_14]|uniref:t-SNARE coiled-coil homology domain-containing protein n=1 Tax=Candidatus Vogelbacteria bacterium CG10_big_fil_rev_8_21_14_0_10_45_14 TaxID=1975042 RepID=A0A2H0RLV5_9BACT|nr:MAG: hypothetical protein COV07_01460 [Candidatus Vogelbacteria bacterium CG10_big_fil_rev_8_21_14_0_10_45_14]